MTLLKKIVFFLTTMLAGNAFFGVYAKGYKPEEQWLEIKKQVAKKRQAQERIEKDIQEIGKKYKKEVYQTSSNPKNNNVLEKENSKSISLKNVAYYIVDNAITLPFKPFAMIQKSNYVPGFLKKVMRWENPLSRLELVPYVNNYYNGGVNKVLDCFKGNIVTKAVSNVALKGTQTAITNYTIGCLPKEWQSFASNWVMIASLYQYLKFFYTLQN